jgi:hypothetical protein
MINSLLTSLIYPKKEIPNDAVLFRSIHFNFVDRSTLRPSASAFKDFELSCDWNRYFTSIDSWNLIAKQFSVKTGKFKDKNHFFISSLHVLENLDLNPPQAFRHDPIFNLIPPKGIPNNRAHSLVIGNKEEKAAVKIRKKLADRSRWEIFDEDRFLSLKHD